MKGFRTTYVLAAVVLVLAGYTFFEYRHAADDLQKSEGERPAFSLKREDIDEIQIAAGGQTTDLHKVDGKWLLTKPVEDLADTPAVEGYLYQVVAQKLKTFQSPEEAKSPDWKQYGLEPPRATVEVGAKGKKESLAVSTKTAFDGNLFVRQGNELLLADAGVTQIADRQASSLRSRRIWRDEGATIERASVESDGGKERFSLIKEKDAWKMEPAPTFSVDGEKVSAWIERVQELMPDEFVKEGVDEKDKAEYLLKKSSLVVKLTYKTKDGKDGSWTLTVGQDKAGDFFLHTNQRPTLYKVKKAGVEKLAVTPSYFRDGKTPFQFPLEQARELKIRTDKLFRTFRKGDAGWTLAEAEKDLELDQDKLVRLIQDIRGLEAQEFLDRSRAPKSKPQIEILGDGGKVLLAVKWGEEYKAKNPWNSGTSLRYVETNVGGHNVLGVPKDKLDRLVDSTIVRKKAPEPAPAGQDGNADHAPVKK